MSYNRNMPVALNIPVEVSAGTHATNVTVQGETVSYNYVHVPLKYTTISGDMMAADVGALFQYKEDPNNQAVVLVDISGNTSSLQTLVESALSGTNLVPVDMSGIVFSDNTSRDLSNSPLKYYVDASTHTTATSSSGSTLAAYIQEYLYENLSSAVGLAGTTGALSVTMNQTQNIASSIVNDLSSSSITSYAIRQNLYEQLYQLAPERFSSGANSSYQPLPFQAGDSLTFLVTFQFPSTLITTPVYQNAMRINGSSIYVGTGNKIRIQTGTTSPVLQNFPDCTVMLRITFSE